MTRAEDSQPTRMTDVVATLWRMQRSGVWPFSTPFDALRWIADAEPAELRVGSVFARFDGAGVRVSFTSDSTVPAAYVVADQIGDAAAALQLVADGQSSAVGGPFLVVGKAGSVWPCFDVEEAVDGRCWRIDHVSLKRSDAARLADWLIGLPKMPLGEHMVH